MFTPWGFFVYNNCMNVDGLLANCDLAVITSPASLMRLSGFDQSDAVILLTENERIYLTNPLYEVAVKGVLSDEWSVRVLSGKEQFAFLVAAVRAAKVVGVEYDHMTLSRYRALFGSEQIEKTVDLSPALAALRLIKSERERNIVKEAEAIVDRVYSHILPQLKVGVTERQIAAEIIRGLLRNGADGTSFDPIVAFGERAAMPHAVPSDRVLRKGDCVLMDFAAKYKGYCSDFTRTVFCGEPTERFREAYALVLAAQNAAVDYLASGGRSAAEADAVARRLIDESDYKGAFNHTLGHGVGIEIHEAPALAARSKDVLSDGMIFTVEPGIYVEGEFGIRIESLLAIENGKLTVIDRSDKQIYTV